MARQRIQSHKNDYLSSKKSKTMEASLQLQIEKLETKLQRYRRDNEDLHNINIKSKELIELHELH